MRDGKLACEFGPTTTMSFKFCLLPHGGTDAHKSSKDKTETNRVVTVEGYDSAGKLIGTYHITKDARVKGKKGKKGTFDYI